jgi:hypothetical protein
VPAVGTTERVQAGHNRELQVVRFPKRKLFGRDRKEVFLEWFAATSNLGWAAEKAGVARQTISKHLLSDPEFAGAYRDALDVSRLRLKASIMETPKPAEPPLTLGLEIEPPDIDMPLDKSLAVLREMEREVAVGRRRGAPPRVASNDEVLKELTKRVKALWKTVERRHGRDGSAPPPPPPEEEEAGTDRDGAQEGEQA